METKYKSDYEDDFLEELQEYEYKEMFEKAKVDCKIKLDT